MSWAVRISNSFCQEIRKEQLGAKRGNKKKGGGLTKKGGRGKQMEREMCAVGRTSEGRSHGGERKQ